MSDTRSKKPKAKGIHSPTEIDFSDIEYGLTVLQEHVDDTDRRKQISEMLLESVEGLGGTGADAFRAAVSEVGWFGGPLNKVREAFSKMLIGSSGWSAKQSVLAEQTSAARNHGKRGGRPKNQSIDEWYLREFEKLKEANPLLSLQAIGDRLALRTAEDGNRRGSSTIQKAIRRAQKVRQ